MPEQSFGGWVERFDATVRVDHHDAVHGGINDGPPSRLAGPQLFFKADALAEIVQHARELALTVDRHLAHGQVQREGRSVPAAPGHLATNADDLRQARL